MTLVYYLILKNKSGDLLSVAIILYYIVCMQLFVFKRQNCNLSFLIMCYLFVYQEIHFFTCFFMYCFIIYNYINILSYSVKNLSIKHK